MAKNKATRPESNEGIPPQEPGGVPPTAPGDELTLEELARLENEGGTPPPDEPNGGTPGETNEGTPPQEPEENCSQGDCKTISLSDLNLAELSDAEVKQVSKFFVDNISEENRKELAREWLFNEESDGELNVEHAPTEQGLVQMVMEANSNLPEPVALMALGAYRNRQGDHYPAVPLYISQTGGAEAVGSVDGDTLTIQWEPGAAKAVTANYVLTRARDENAIVLRSVTALRTSVEQCSQSVMETLHTWTKPELQKEFERLIDVIADGSRSGLDEAVREIIEADDKVTGIESLPERYNSLTDMAMGLQPIMAMLRTQTAELKTLSARKTAAASALKAAEKQLDQTSEVFTFDLSKPVMWGAFKV